MEMDIGANNYPFQCFLCFLTLKLHPSFLLTTINHESCTLSQLFTQHKNISYKETLDKISFQNRFYTQTVVKWSWYTNISHTESWPYFITQFEDPQRANGSTKTVRSLILIFNQYAPIKFFLVLATILIQICH